MNYLEPERRWHQFSLRSLLLFSTLIAIICSIGASTHWTVAAELGVSLIVGAVCGGIVRGTRVGLSLGAAYAIPGFIFAIVLMTVLMFPGSGLWDHSEWAIVCRIAVLAGGILGGVSGGIAARAQ
jgi:hypothetical protein